MELEKICMIGMGTMGRQIGIVCAQRGFETMMVDADDSQVARGLKNMEAFLQGREDRGFVFYPWRGVNRFERLLETHGIDHTHARPHHPQTLGKVEACNRRIKRELIDQHHFPTMHDTNSELEQWVYHYNYAA